VTFCSINKEYLWIECIVCEPKLCAHMSFKTGRPLKLEFLFVIKLSKNKKMGVLCRVKK
jgi:hypothetical protein